MTLQYIWDPLSKENDSPSILLLWFKKCRTLQFVLQWQKEKVAQYVINYTFASLWTPAVFIQFNPCLTKGSVTNTLKNFSLFPQNQKESDLSHLGDISDIRYGHFDGKKNEVPPYLGLE